MHKHKAEPAPVVHARSPVDRDTIDVAQPQPFAQTLVDRVCRQSGPMFDPPKTLLFGGSQGYSLLAIELVSMSDNRKRQRGRFLFNRVEHSIVTDSKPKFFAALQALGGCRNRILLQRSDGAPDS